MNRNFMQEYYGLKYQEGLLPLLLGQDGESSLLYEKIMELEGQLEEAMRQLGKEYLELHQSLFRTRGELEALILPLAYLQGAEDREDMLR